jgi:epoxyqueuosine reductase
MDLQHTLRENAEAQGADFFGVADLAPARAAILAQGGPAMAAYPRAISVGIALLNSIVDGLPRWADRSDRAVAVHYRQHCYDVVNQRLDLLTSRLSSILQRAGHQALPIPASKRVDDARICAAFSHKLAAHMAGLGWIGKSCLLITPQAGPRVRWATILTDAPLQPTGGPMEQRCGECTLCVDICPVQAFTGEPFRPGEPREKRYDAARCEGHLNALTRQDLDTGVCGLCLYVCPVSSQRS